MMVAHISLYSADGEVEKTYIRADSLKEDPRYSEQLKSRTMELDANYAFERLLDGTSVSSCYLLTDLYGSRGAYFVFEDLSIKMEGTYRLQLSLSILNKYLFTTYELVHPEILYPRSTVV